MGDWVKTRLEKVFDTEIRVSSKAGVAFSEETQCQ